jgi:hypothetical protein
MSEENKESNLNPEFEINPNDIEVNDVEEVNAYYTKAISNAEKAIQFLNNRKGFDDWWYNLDMEIQQEILVELSKIIG